MLSPLPAAQSFGLQSALVETLVSITEPSGHGHEQAMYRLLLDLGDLLALGHLTRAEYASAIGIAADVLFYFNYEPTSLAAEPDRWYRAAIIHQMGQGMLQAIALQRPEFVTKTFYREALNAFSLERAGHVPTAMPLHCRQWPSLVHTAPAA